MQDFLLKRASLAVIILMLTGGCTGCDLNSGSRDIDDQQAITLCWKHSFVPIWDLSTLQLNITAPLFSGSRVYAAYNTEMVCLDASNGEVIWERGLGNPTAFNVDQVVEDDHYVFVAAGPKVYAVNKSSGELAWITNLNTRSERGFIEFP